MNIKKLPTLYELEQKRMSMTDAMKKNTLKTLDFKKTFQDDKSENK